jgi:hypothetical protein
LDSIDVGLAWRYKDGAVATNVYSSLYTKQIGVLNGVGSKVRRWTKANVDIDRTVYGLILWGENARDADGEYSLEPLENIVNEWISIWRKAGGATKLFST